MARIILRTQLAVIAGSWWVGLPSFIVVILVLAHICMRRSDCIMLKGTVLGGSVIALETIDVLCDDVCVEACYVTWSGS